MAQENGREIRDHKYHAEATAVEGMLELPHMAKIAAQAHSQVLPTARSKEDPPRFYESQHAKPFREEGIISYTAAHTQASGHVENKHGNPFVTLSTSVIENLNILNVITCDRVVAQISTEHPRFEDDGHVPSVTFLGSQFYNLRIAGFPVEVELDLALLNPDEHSHKIAYTKNDAFITRIAARLGIFRDKGSKAPADLQAYYAARETAADGSDCTHYSLVTGVKGTFPGTSYANVLDIPHFGKVHLGVVRIKHSDYEKDIPRTTLIELTMIDVRMGCLASGSVNCCVTKNNGTSTPGTGGN